MMRISNNFYDFLSRITRYNGLAERIYHHSDYIAYFNENIDCDYFDIDEEGISFLSNSKPSLGAWNSRYRQKMKPGSFLTKIFKNPDPKQVESFIKYFKASFRTSNNLKFKIVSGEDIKFWYRGENYAPGGGNLNNSCMRYKESSEYLNIYSENTDKVSMLILIDESIGLISGRAILWGTDCGKTLCDRVYVNEQHLENLFINYLTENSITFKYKQSYGDVKFYIDGVGEPVMRRFEVTLNKFDMDKYPYMDTMKFFHTEGGILSNYNFTDSEKPDPIIRTITTDTGGWVASNELVIDEVMECWIARTSSVRLEYINKTTGRGNTYYSKTYDCYILKSDSRYSDEYQDYIFFNDKYNDVKKLGERKSSLVSLSEPIKSKTIKSSYVNLVHNLNTRINYGTYYGTPGNNPYLYDYYMNSVAPYYIINDVSNNTESTESDY